MSATDEPSVLGLNTWVLGEFAWQDRTDPYDLLRTAVRNDLTYLDCSPLYAGGKSEETVGSILSDLDAQADCFIASKFGIRRTDSGNFVPINNYDGLCKQIQGSLDRLGRESMNLCYLYQNFDRPLGTLAEWASRLREEKWCENTGLVVLKQSLLPGTIPETFDYIQRPGSVLDQFGDSNTLSTNSATVGYDPLFGGLFDQRYAEVDSEVLDYEVRRHHPKFTANRVGYLSTLKEMQHDHRENEQANLPLESRTLQWLLNHGADQHLVVGMRNADEVHQALRGASIDNRFDEERGDFIEPIRRVWEKQGSPEFVTPPPLLPRHSFERHVLSDRIQ